MRTGLKKVVLTTVTLALTAFGQGNAPSGAVTPQDPGKIIHFLSFTVSWYRQRAAEDKLVNEPTDLTFAQEIELFKNAEAFAGVMGSGFTNGIWSSPHCKVIMFVPENRPDGWAEGICVANQLDFYWKTFPSDHAEMITVDLGEVKKLMAQAGL